MGRWVTDLENHACVALHRNSFNSYKERELVDSLMACMKQIKARDTGNCQNPVCSRRLVLANVFPPLHRLPVQSLSCKILPNFVYSRLIDKLYPAMTVIMSVFFNRSKSWVRVTNRVKQIFYCFLFPKKCPKTCQISFCILKQYKTAGTLHSSPTLALIIL